MKNRLIVARKHSEDPAQEQIRERKHLWNVAATDLITRLIAFKRGLNGRGDVRAGLPPSTITEPFPPQIGQFLHELATDYAALVDGAEAIIDSQEEYGHTRRRPMVHSFAEEDLVKTASWWGSRWWASHIGIKSPEKKIIRDMIDCAVSFREKLEDVENHLTSSDPNAIAKALYVTSAFGIGPFKNLMEDFDKLKKIHNKVMIDEEDKNTISSSGEKDSTPISVNPSKIKLYNSFVEIQKDLHSMQSVVNYLLSSDIDEEKKKELKKIKNTVNKSVDISKYIGKLDEGLTLSAGEELDANAIVLSYRKLLVFTSSCLGYDCSTFEEYARNIQKKEESLKTVAHNDVSRFLKRKWLEHKFNVLRKDVDLDKRKKETINHILESIRALESLMDVLIAGPDADKIFSELKNFSINLANVIEDIITLSEIHNSMFRDEYRSKRKNSVLHQIIEREINKLRKTNVGVKEMSSKILINKPDFVVVPT